MTGKATKDKLLAKAVEAGKQGDHQQARQTLLKLLHMDNREPLYWLLMSTAVDSREERIYCLQNVLFLDPENSAARHDLELLDADIPQSNVPAFFPEENDDWHTKEIAAPKMRKRRRKSKEKPWSVASIMGSLGLGIAFIIMLYYAAENNLLDGLFESLPSVPSPAATQAAGGPPLVITVQVGQPTATLPVLMPSNPQELLSATYTPTPRYVNTPHPENPAYEQGLAALAAGDWAGAATEFEALLTANPQAADAAYYLGLAHAGGGDLNAASTAFDRAIGIQPGFAPAYLERARLSIATGSGDTITDLNTAILLDARYVDAYLERAAFNLGRGNPEAAAQDVSAAEALAPDSPLVLYQKARVALARGEHAAALQASQQAHDLDLTLLPNYLAKAEAEQGVGDQAASIATMQRYLTFNGGDGRGWELLGLGFQHSGQPREALDAFDHALTLDPGLPQASYYRGLQELADGRNARGLVYMQIAVGGLPDWFEARIGLARAQLANGNPNAAFLEINASSSRITNDEQRAMFFYWRALALEALGQEQNARADWQSLLDLPAGAAPDEWRETAQSRLGG
ncbi:MAG: tetratricopeptide repeat protein [Anaerolineales bacterium]|nr:tetratricopeptide repeat protein [Anaerolineales bacterium]